MVGADHDKGGGGVGIATGPSVVSIPLSGKYLPKKSSLTSFSKKCSVTDVIWRWADGSVDKTSVYGAVGSGFDSESGQTDDVNKFSFLTRL